jgi:2-polyprenyl-3-methyl-5-hydroxy-6-metoxy-1,4-benzoquinol methylase
MGEIYQRATNPKQYDLNDINWMHETSDSPHRMFYYEYLQKYKDKWKNAKVLDIGSGLGWLLLKISQNGASIVEGIEPSKNNYLTSQKQHPSLTVHNTDLENFETKKQYNIITGIMVFNHIADINKAFEKIYALLEDKGEIWIIIHEFYYAQTPRFGYEIEKEKINDDEYALKVDRKSWKIIADVVRKEEVYIKAAQKAGLRLIETAPITPTSDLIKKIPQYAILKNTPTNRLLRFQK